MSTKNSAVSALVYISWPVISPEKHYLLTVGEIADCTVRDHLKIERRRNYFVGGGGGVEVGIDIISISSFILFLASQ